MSSSFSQMFSDILRQGKVVSPRGQPTLELLNYRARFDPYERFASFPSRKLSLNYIKDEVLWYLRGHPTDLSICDKAKLWHEMVTDGRLNSNYGYPIFRQGGLDYVVKCLTHDPDSRRALISILRQQHLYAGNKDVPCTVSLGFRIRDGQLQLTAHQRSADAIFGCGNDVPFFSLVQEMVLVMLNEGRAHEDLLELGPLTLFMESCHVYEKHWGMLEALAHDSVVPVYCPQLSGSHEVSLLRLGVSPNPQQEHKFPFTEWLHSRDPKKEKTP